MSGAHVIFFAQYLMSSDDKVSMRYVKRVRQQELGGMAAGPEAQSSSPRSQSGTLSCQGWKKRG